MRETLSFSANKSDKSTMPRIASQAPLFLMEAISLSRKGETTDTVNFFGYHHITKLKSGNHAEKFRSVSPSSR